MYLLGKRVYELEANDIERLAQNNIQESRSLDYKKELKLRQDKDRKEFLFDVTAMYNTDGGCLLFGIEESKDEYNQNTGKPEKICGITIENADKLTQQIEDLIRGNTEPSISNIGIKVLNVSGKYVLILGIPKSLGLPAMVTFNETNKFYKRRNSGKYPVDVYELNQMFIQNQVLKEKAEQFRLKRIEKVRNKEVFFTLDTRASFFIHIIPFSFLNDDFIDLTIAEDLNIASLMRPMAIKNTGFNNLHNFDGYVTLYQNNSDLIIYSYDQIFRNGIYEVYTSLVFEENTLDNKNHDTYNLLGDNLIKDTVNKIQNSLEVLKKLRLEPPFLICLSLHNTLGGTIKNQFGRGIRAFTVKEIILPPAIIPNYETEIYKHLRSTYDILWQCIGIAKSPEYNRNQLKNTI